MDLYYHASFFDLGPLKFGVFKKYSNFPRPSFADFCEETYWQRKRVEVVKSHLYKDAFKRVWIQKSSPSHNTPAVLGIELINLSVYNILPKAVMREL